MPSAGIPLQNEPPAVENNPAVRLQWAYRIDTSLVLPLQKLPPSIADGAALAALNLKRGNLPTYNLATGQMVARALNEPPLDPSYLVVRAEGGGEGFTYKSIASVDPSFLVATPLWFYILAEAQVPVVDLWRGANPPRDLEEDDFMSGPGSRSQLGPVGGRILMEVFNGLVDADPRSFRNSADAATWQPMIGNTITFWHLLRFTGLV
jgi:hypothetical protein